MTREEKFLYKVDRSRSGVEIGPSYSPIASERAGIQIHTIDHLGQEGLRLKYKAHNVNIDKVEVVDFVWDGKSYAELTGNRNFYQWIIASHFIEHTPDIVAFLIQCEEILADQGVLSLVVPNSGFCFEHLRSIGSISEVIDAHLQKRKIHSAGNGYDHFANVITQNKSISWLENQVGVNRLVNSC